ncbi:hypothetical protein D1159_03940 [Pseudoflavonifractor sp. 524-17]|uniref:hypothetical protein n=1 Tax=Pseudoflavonifractor sp. 524-17 TaxID=2304577 RepID=UPI00137B6547|nr:hypothetical protein [Pseudoflavonifractor sp. 524-17]NCE63749.1 hypothetical protein [Pseudoflavonifractor sp. 524-17]
MDGNETIQSFGDMVNAAERLTKPWRVALLVTNFLWALVFALFIWLAYLSPDTSYQYQDFEGKAQVQSAGSEVVTQGD